MSDGDLIGYLFDLLDPDDRAAVAARVAADPKVAAHLELLRATVAPMLAVMDAERDEPPEPRPGLAVRAVARLAEHVVESEPREPEPVAADAALAGLFTDLAADAPAELEFASGTRAKRPQPAPAAAPARPAPPLATPALAAAPPPTGGPEYRGGLRLRADLLVAAAIAFVGVGLLLSGVAKARHQSRVYACQNSLRTLYTGLSGYADADLQGRYPQVGTAELPTADAFAASLVKRQLLPPDYKPGCPADPTCPTYAYTLGFRGPNKELVGLRRPTTSDAAEENDLMPIAADLPAPAVAPAAGAFSPHGDLMEVLFAGGNVRSTRSPHVGPRGDHIYCNVFGHVAAGADRTDAVLGGSGAQP